MHIWYKCCFLQFLKQSSLVFRTSSSAHLLMIHLISFLHPIGTNQLEQYFCYDKCHNIYRLQTIFYHIAQHDLICQENCSLLLINPTEVMQKLLDASCFLHLNQRDIFSRFLSTFCVLALNICKLSLLLCYFCWCKAQLITQMQLDVCMDFFLLLPPREFVCQSH